MNQAFLDEMKAKLEAEQAELTQELDSVSSPDVGDHVPGDRDPKFPNYGDDNLGENTESPAEIAAYAANVDVTGRLEAKQTAVQAALQRIADGAYGTCSRCGNAIPEDRLRAEPAAAVCMQCSSAHD